MDYNKLGQRLSMDAAGVIATCVMDGSRPLTAESAGNTTFYLYGRGAIGEKTNEWAYSLPDGTNTPRQLTDIQGEITLSARYTPWGDSLELHGTGNFSFGYLGGVLDATTGLLYVGNGQYYDPSTGRFLTRDVYPNSANPYVPWNPIGAIVGPLGLIALVFGKRKKGSRVAQFLVLVLVLGSVGMTLAACGGAPADSTVEAVVTPISSNTAIVELTVDGNQETPVVVASPTKTVEEIFAEMCASISAPSSLPKLTIFFGGSWGQDRIHDEGPDPAYQTNAWHEIADESIKYPGDKTNHAKLVNISAYANFNLVVIGYSSGADSALIFAYAYYEEQGKQGFSGRITGLAMLGGTFTGSLIGGGNIDARWPEIFDDLIMWGTNIYVLNDSTRTSSVASGYSRPPCENENAGRFWYHDLPDQQHWSGPWNTEVSYLNNGTNNSASYRDTVLSWLDN